MRNVLGSLRRHGLCHGNNTARSCLGFCAIRDIQMSGRKDKWSPLFFTQQYLFSTGYTSIHGERPSAEYAKLRKESLESEFGQALGKSSKGFSVIYHFGPSLALYRAAIISFYVLKLTVWQFFVRDMKERAIKDQIPPFPTLVAIESIEAQVGAPISKIFADISPEPIAAASLGQVYKAHLHSGELVAVKVQRPGMPLALTLDAMLFHMVGGQLKRFAKARKDLLVAVNEMVRHMFAEIDYIIEGKNAERFATLYGSNSFNDQKIQPEATAGSTAKSRNPNSVKVPKIYWDLTRKAVLTMEWIDGIKLTDEAKLKRACLDRRKLIDQGVYCSLRQLLEVGFFHADPHPGNLVATDDGSLAYFDFGMMGDIPRHYRVGLIQVLVHFVNRDSLGLANDFLSLGFIPEGVDVQAVSDALRASFVETRQSNDFQGVMNQLYDVMYEFNFSLPPDYALVIRALGSLEGTAKVLDPDFKVIETAYPFVIGRLLADSNPDMRKILRELVIRNDGSIRWNRLERLVAAISEQASKSAGETSPTEGDFSSAMEWKSFDMRSVVAATEDLLLFILSEKGMRVRIFVLRDIMKAADAFLQDEVLSGILNEKLAATEESHSEDHAMLLRVVKGFQSLNQAVKMAPELWSAMLIRMVLKREFQGFITDILSTLLAHSRFKLPEASWICISRLLHKLVDDAREL